ncbi:unnamed protein product [Didymodactylos carnosus]|uniref:SAMD1-like winged helix (WH) domain-containing protein n=1 Tax=Didymodactylos carnosus TaxID=1234261 RepID=A0A8S2CWC3_9BILA|nr:unnamed protein product [Didymodactylos carnosus]CAF3564170.1 unnamed protein product [Didymodactylos carnosus]
MSHYIVQPTTTTITATTTTTTLFNNQQQEQKPPRAQSPSFIRKRNLKQLACQQQLLLQNDIGDLRSDLQTDSSSSSSSFSSASSSPITSLPTSTSSTVVTCDLLNVITDQRFKPVFEAIDEIKKRKCRPDLDRIIKYVTKRNNNYLRNDILIIIDELLKLGLVTKIFHKGGFTIRIKNDKCAKLIERMNNFNIQKSVISSSPSSMHLSDNTNQQQQVLMQTITPTQLVLNSNEENTHTSNLIVIEQKPNMKENKINNDGKFLLPLPPPPPSPIIPLSQSVISTKRTRNSKKTAKVKKRKLTQSISSLDIEFKTLPVVTYKQSSSSSSILTMELILGLNGEIPDVHSWTTDDLNKFFTLNGYDYASQVFKKYRINGNNFYSLNKELVFKKSMLKVGKALKLWNVIQQIQQNQSLRVS